MASALPVDQARPNVSVKDVMPSARPLKFGDATTVPPIPLRTDRPKCSIVPSSVVHTDRRAPVLLKIDVVPACTTSSPNCV